MVMMAGVGSAKLRPLVMLLGRWKRCAAMLLAVWILVAYFFISPYRCSTKDEVSRDENETAELKARFRAVSSQLEQLRYQHSSLIAQVKASRMRGNHLEDIDIDEGPSIEYETLRRRIYTNTKELWYYVSHELGKAIEDSSRAEILQALLEQVDDRKRVLLADQQRLASADGHAEWRTREANEVSALVQRRLRALQHPANCDTARKVICNLNKGCGFGCQIHHIAYCLIFAYATERTLVLKSRGWRYNTKGWDQVFMPLSDNCTNAPDTAQHWPDEQEYDSFVKKFYGNPLPVSEANVVSLPFIDSMSSKPKFLPQAVPKDLGKRVARFNGDPASWWVGQMLRYILRPRPALATAINNTASRLHYRSPIVGVHIRRTDKVGTEAAFHHLNEYMRHVDQYWKVQDLVSGSPVPRRVYLASDDPKVIVDARRAYPDIEFIGDPEISRTAATHRRYTPASLTGLLVDLTLLARADYLVCTFSSQVCRMAYELMQANRPDAADSFYSLDDIYYFGGQNPHDRIALMAHAPRDMHEIALKEGDLVGVAGNHWNGYGSGVNRRTLENGLWPWYKTADHLVLYPFPTYDKVPKKESPTAGQKSPTTADLANLFAHRDTGL